jgi:Adenine specific DNA methylase Mod
MTIKQTAKFQELVAKLREIFQIDRPDLDFGIYRILNARAGEINEYLANRLYEKVQAALRVGTAASAQQLQAELQEAERNAHALGVSPDGVPKVQELRAKLKEATTGASEHEDAVFSHMLTFFSRYYDNGDFISQRRYKGNTYAIPYAGEEVMLHWANKDQYFTKSGENFANYSFKLEDGRAVHFRLVAADTAKDNRKDNDMERRFALIEQKCVTRIDEQGDAYGVELLPVEEVDGSSGKELIVRFEYKPVAKGAKQDALVGQAIQAVLANDAVKARWLDLGKRAPTEKNPQRTVLEKHITDYTNKNLADYFIHKDLGGFLRRELDFYIKNEVMNLDNVQNAGEFADIEKNLRMIQCLRAIALELIAFLAQLEDFQKRLWLKKKFVVSRHYCITLDRVPDALYPEIVANERQWEQWRQLGIWDGDVPGTIEDLKAEQYRMVDTALFDASFCADLLMALTDLDDNVDGLLVHGDNFQALSLLGESLRERVKCIYIDPPYNTGKNDFPYKDGFQAASWFTMMLNRAVLAKSLLNQNGLIAVQIGDQEAARSRIMLEQVFPERKNSAIVRRGIKNVQAQFKDIDKLSLGYDVIHIFSARPGTRLPHLRHRLQDGKNGKWDTFWRGTDRATMRYELFGHTPTSGQWRWEENRTKRSVANYDHYLEYESKHKSLDDWWIENMQSGTDLDFVRCNEDGVVQYYVPPQDFKLVSDNWLDIPSSGSITDFPHEKSIPLLQRVIGWNCANGDIVLDYFAGSGSTSHAVIEFLRGGTALKHVSIEQGSYFESMLKPRLKRAVFSAEWKDGKPTAPETGISHCFKVLKLESYEDTLNNLQLRRASGQDDLFAKLPEQTKDDYVLNYMLDVESRGSLLSVADFKKPFDYTLKVAVDSAGAYEVSRIDLVETFNYLIGLHVKHIDANPKRGFVTVTGALPSGETCLVLWRDCDILDYEGVSNLCDRLAINPADNEFDVVYINGDHNIPTVLTQTAEEGGATRVLKLRQIEPEFLARMFSVEDI